MKKNILLPLASILLIFALLFSATQASANPGGVKPTPKPGQSGQTQGNAGSTTHGNGHGNGNGNSNGNANRNGNVNGQNGGQHGNGNQNGGQNGNKQDHAKNGKVANFIGTVSAVPNMDTLTGGQTPPGGTTGGDTSGGTTGAAPAAEPTGPTLTVILRGGGTVNFIITASTIVKIPGMKNASINDIHVGDSVVVHAFVDSQGVMTARMINLVPGKPMHFHYVGQVTAYTPASAGADGSITIMDKNGVSHTFIVTAGTTFVPPDLAANLALGVWVTIVSGPAKGGGTQTAESIVIFETATEGLVTAYTAPTDTTPGSLTIKDKNGVEMTFNVTTKTSISPADLAGFLGVGVWVKVVSSPSPLGGTQTALTITISASSFEGVVTAFTAATAGGPGSLAITTSSGPMTFTVTDKTAVLPADQAAMLGVGVQVTVLASGAPGGTQTALSITITSTPFAGEVTAYTAAKTGVPGSITVLTSGGSMTFTVTDKTAILPAELAAMLGAGETVTGLASGPAGTQTALSITITTASYSGKVTAYTAAVDATHPGSITIQPTTGNALTFVVLFATKITPAAEAASLAVNAMVTIQSSPNAAMTGQTAFSINIDQLPPGP